MSIGFHLQGLRPDNYINLPLGRLAPVLQKSPPMVSNYIRVAKANRYLTLIGKHPSPQERQQSSYLTLLVSTRKRSKNKALTASKERKEVQDSEDCKELDESQRRVRNQEEPGRSEGVSGSRIDFKRSEGKTRAANSPEKRGGRQLLKAQLAIIESRYVS